MQYISVDVSAIVLLHLNFSIKYRMQTHVLDIGIYSHLVMIFVLRAVHLTHTHTAYSTSHIHSPTRSQTQIRPHSFSVNTHWNGTKLTYNIIKQMTGIPFQKTIYNTNIVYIRPNCINTRNWNTVIDHLLFLMLNRRWRCRHNGIDVAGAGD